MALETLKITKIDVSLLGILIVSLAYPVRNNLFLLLKHYELFVVHGAKISAVTSTRSSLFLNWLTFEILAQNIPERVQRNNPRVVKKPGSKFRSKQVKHRAFRGRQAPLKDYRQTFSRARPCDNNLSLLTQKSQEGKKSPVVIKNKGLVNTTRPQLIICCHHSITIYSKNI